ncbi:hypothetical protein Mal15_17910 [Stieleria maiorica]|uniref:Uncharacterized protein n=1 Tax=Stieleria maiorica TaxID=2795974 RepID=A0A5B9MEZ5_9BACT|nr:hypothetical protein [Stieleria maiorica]QEF97747.1 hypothetical protein Mal15_17910 [Stieleria maiorica]
MSKLALTQTARTTEAFERVDRMIEIAEKNLASIPGSRHEKCSIQVPDESVKFFVEPYRKVCLEFGRLDGHPRGCLHLAVSEQYDGVDYRVWLLDEEVPPEARVAVASQIPELMLLAVKVNARIAEEAERVALAIELMAEATKTLVPDRH